MNSTANPEVEMADRVAALMGAALTEADVHRFLLDAADILGTESFAVYGPDLFFRWRLGERVVEIKPDYDSRTGEYSLQVRSFDRRSPVYEDEYLTFEYGGLDEYPYLWTVGLGRLPWGEWGPSESVIDTWDMFDQTMAVILRTLPDNLALMPPQWRHPLTLRWDMGTAGLGLVSFTGTAEGLTVTVEATGEEVLIPRNLLGSERSQISMRDVVAGLAGGLPLADIRFAGSEGFDSVCVTSPGGDEPGWDSNDVESLPQDRGEDSPRPDMTMDDLRRLVTIAPAVEPAGPGMDQEILPIRIGLSIPEVLHVVGQIVTGADGHATFRRLGGQPRVRWGEPVLRGDDWLARRSHTGDGWMIDVAMRPEDKSQCFDKRQVADYAWRIAQALEQRYSSPYGTHTDNNGYLSRLFQVGDHGVTVRGGLSAVMVEIDTFESLASNDW